MTLVVLGWAQGKVLTENETVLLGRPASLKCSLQNSQEVLIVTWQKVKNGKTENMGTFSQTHGEVIQPIYKNKVNFTHQGLRESTITFWKTIEEDEGCYLCIFNIFAFDTDSGKTCLLLYVQPIVSLNYEFFEGHLNVNCSATARPPPEVSWKVSKLEGHNSTESIIKHPNGTTSVTSILYIKDATNQEGKKMVCNVKHMEIMMAYDVIPRKNSTAHAGQHVPIVVSVLVPVLLLLILISILFYWKCHRRQTRGEINVSTQKPGIEGQYSGKSIEQEDLMNFLLQ